MTKSLVIDASFAFRLIVPGQKRLAFRTLMTQWKRDGCVITVPALWIYEMTSALCKMVRFGELTLAEGQRALDVAHKMDLQLIVPDKAQVRLAFEWSGGG
jgi:predicted nucleic acid-binding protein